MNEEYNLYVEREKIRERMKALNLSYFYANPSAKVNNDDEYIALKNRLYELDLMAIELKGQKHDNN